MYKWLLIVPAIGILSTTACATAEQATGDTQLSKYVAIDGKNELVVDGTTLSVGPTHNRIPSTGLDGKPWSVSLRNCSDAEVRCVNAERFTFAVLKAQAHENEKYSVDGVEFTVVKCDDVLCHSQHIVSNCDHWSVTEVGICKPFDGSEAGKESDISLAYKYEVGKGIVSIDIKYAGVDLTDANRFVLSGDRALLAP